MKTGNAQILGIGYFITVEWGALNAMSRTWDHKVALAMHASNSLAMHGIWTWMRIDTSGGAKIIAQEPFDGGWKLLRTGEVYSGLAHMSSFDIDTPTTRSAPSTPGSPSWPSRSACMATTSPSGSRAWH